MPGENQEEVCPAVSIVHAILELERARKNSDEEAEDKAYEEYCKHFTTLMGYAPESNTEQNITLVRIINKYGTMISKSLEAQVRAMVALFSASSLFKKISKKTTISYEAPSQETINRWTKNLKKENEDRDPDSQKTEYIPEAPKKYQLNLVELQARFMALSRHMELFTKMCQTIVRKGRAKVQPESFKSNYTPFVLGPEFVAFFNDEEISSYLEISNKKFSSILREFNEDGTLQDQDFSFTMQAARDGLAMRRTVIAAIYIYARVKNLLRTMNKKERSVTGFIFDEALERCFATGKNNLFDRLLSRGNAFNKVDVDFTSKGKEKVDKLESTASKSQTANLKQLKKNNTGVKFLPIYFVQNLISEGVDSQRKVTVEGQVLVGAKITEAERTPEMERVLLDDIHHIQRLKEVLDRKDVKDRLLEQLSSE